MRDAVTTKPVERTAQLKHQIAQLMAILTQTRWGNGHSSNLSSPQKCSHGCGGSSNSHPNSHNSRGGPDQMTQAHSLLAEHAGEDTGRRNSEQGNQGPSVRGEDAACSWDPPSLQGYKCQGWDHMARECPTLASALNQPGGTEGMQLTPWPATAAQGNNKPLAFPPQPLAKTSNYEGHQTEGQVGGVPSHPLSKPRPNSPSSEAVQWNTHNHWWAEGDCINQLEGTGL